MSGSDGVEEVLLGGSVACSCGSGDGEGPLDAANLVSACCVVGAILAKLSSVDLSISGVCDLARGGGGMQ